MRKNVRQAKAPCYFVESVIDEATISRVMHLVKDDEPVWAGPSKYGEEYICKEAGGIKYSLHEKSYVRNGFRYTLIYWKSEAGHEQNPILVRIDTPYD